MTDQAGVHIPVTYMARSCVFAAERTYAYMASMDCFDILLGKSNSTASHPPSMVIQSMHGDCNNKL